MINLNMPMVTLAAFMALIPFNSSAEHGGCHLNGDEADVGDAGDDYLGVIEGTRKGDVIDCRDYTSESLLGYKIYGYGGDDIIWGSPYDDFIAGGGGEDEIHGGDGNDDIDGGAKNDMIYGDGGDDVIFGGVGSSPASGVGCELRTEFVASGSSYLTKGGSGDDDIWGGPGDDCINAGSGEDYVEGGDGNDTIYGGNHADVLIGGLGDDYIDGGWHTDECVGDEGEGDEGDDTFINCETEIE